MLKCFSFSSYISGNHSRVDFTKYKKYKSLLKKKPQHSDCSYKHGLSGEVGLPFFYIKPEI